jgi:hypothetical protein
MSAAWLLCGLHSACVGGIDLSGAATDLGAPVARVSAEAGPSAIGCRGRFPRAVGDLISLSSWWSESISCSRPSRRSSRACSNSSLDDRGGSASMARASCYEPVNSRRPRGAGGKEAGQRMLLFSAKRSSTLGSTAVLQWTSCDGSPAISTDCSLRDGALTSPCWPDCGPAWSGGAPSIEPAGRDRRERPALLAARASRCPANLPRNARKRGAAAKRRLHVLADDWIMLPSSHRPSQLHHASQPEGT